VPDAWWKLKPITVPMMDPPHECSGSMNPKGLSILDMHTVLLEEGKTLKEMK
jgi:hypothetical protein